MEVPVLEVRLHFAPSTKKMSRLVPMSRVLHADQQINDQVVVVFN